MRKFFTKIILVVLILLPFNIATAENLGEKLKGKILLQVESKGEAWYVSPSDGQRYYLGRPADAFIVMRSLGLGISNKDFNSFKNYAPKNLSGKILLKVEDSGKAYYANPVDLRLHYLGKPSDAFNVMRNLGVGISNQNLSQISISGKSGMPTNSNTAPSGSGGSSSNNSLDGDKDGLTDSEEDRMGTNKNKADTDGDMVNDGVDEHPLDVGAKINKAFQVTDSYKNKYTISINIPVDYYLYYKNHMPHSLGSNYEKLTSFITSDDYYLKQIFVELNNLNNRLRDESIAEKGYNDTLVISGIEEIFRQNLYNYDINTGYDEYPKYPIETIVEGSGDCEDLSFLFASLMVIESNGWNEWAGAGKKVTLLRFPGHLGVGIAFPTSDWEKRWYDIAIKLDTISYYEKNGLNYYYYETTDPAGKLGVLPPSLNGVSAYMYLLN